MIWQGPTCLAEMSPVMQAVVGGCIVLVCAIGMGVLVKKARRRSLEKNENSGGAGFSVDELQDMLGEGKLTPQEYKRLRRIALGLPPLEAAAPENSPPAEETIVVEDVQEVEEPLSSPAPDVDDEEDTAAPR